MANQVLMPKQGNSVESCIIVEWKKKVGDTIAKGEVLCEVETDKSTIEVESTAEGTVLALLYKEGDDVPVQIPIAVVGQAGEAFDIPAAATSSEPVPEKVAEPSKPAAAEKASEPVVPGNASEGTSYSGLASPRAKNLAASSGIKLDDITATGPKGRIIERDVKAALAGRQPLTKAALDAFAEGKSAPSEGSGIGQRVRLCDMYSHEVKKEMGLESDSVSFPEEKTEIPVKSIRKVTAKRMHESLATTAQLTLVSYADARELKALRAKFKAAPEALGVGKITINDLVMFAVSRTLADFPAMNAHWMGDKIVQYKNIHLGMATDTEKGLMVPVIRNCDKLSLKGISGEAKRLGGLCHEGKAGPDELSGSTFTVTNVGAFGVESFTPVINIPEVAILGVGAIVPKATEINGKIEFIDSICLSLTVDHQAIDGAPGARFLKALCSNIADIDMLLAVRG